MKSKSISKIGLVFVTCFSLLVIFSISIAFQVDVVMAQDPTEEPIPDPTEEPTAVPTWEPGQPPGPYRTYLPFIIEPTRFEYSLSGYNQFFSGYFYVIISVTNTGNVSYGPPYGDLYCPLDDKVDCVNLYPKWAAFRITDRFGVSNVYYRSYYSWDQSVVRGERIQYYVILRKANGENYDLGDFLEENSPLPIRSVEIEVYDVQPKQSAQIYCSSCYPPYTNYWQTDLLKHFLTTSCLGEGCLICPEQEQ